MTDDKRREFAERRRGARVLAMQMMFEADFTRKPLDRILQRRLLEEEVPEPVGDYAEYLLRGAWEHRDEFDRMIAEAAPTWPLDQMARIDRNIMRLAMYEMLYSPEVPIRAAINEAVELAKEFGSDASRRFVNGVLGTIASEHGEAKRTHVAPGDE